MADQIFIDTEKYLRIANRLQLLSQDLNDCASSLGNVNMSRDSGADLNISLTGRIKSTGTSISSGQIDDCLRSLKKTIVSLGKYSNTKASHIRSAVNLFESSEHEVSSLLIHQSVGDPAPFTTANGALNWVISSLIDRASSALSLQQFIQQAQNVVTDYDITIGQIGAALGLFVGDHLISTLSTDISATSVEFTRTTRDGLRSSELTGSIGLDSSGKAKLVDIDRESITEPSQGGGKADSTKKVENPFSGRLNLLTVKEQVGYTESVINLNGTIENEKGSVSGEIDLFMINAEASAQAGLYAVKVGPDGKKTYTLSPGASAKAGVSVTAFEANASANYEIIDGISVNSDVSVTAGKASAETELLVGMVDGEFAAYGKAEAELIGGEIKGDVGVDIAGVEGTVSASLNYGIGAHAEAGYKDGVLKVDVGASIGVGGSIAFELDVGGAIDNALEFASDVGNAAKGAVDSFFSLFS